MVDGKPRVGISACLLGQRMRYDGAHCLDPYLRGILGRHVEWVSLCPESECGFPIPREPMRLKGVPASPRLMTVLTGKDQTERMRRWAERRLRDLEEEGLCGFIFKAGSPSCGLQGVKVHPFAGGAPRGGSGIFASAFTRRFPLLPVSDEAGMGDPSTRERFIEAAFVVKRWRLFLAAGATLEGLVEFHSDHELLIKAHSPEAAAEMRRLLARPNARSRRRLMERYEADLAAALARQTTVAKNARVLTTVFTLLKGRLSSGEAAHVSAVVNEYREGHVPLLVPIVLLRHYGERFRDPYLSRQRFLDPYPAELGMRARG